MENIPQTRIKLAARFCTDEISLNLLIRDWNDGEKALIRVGTLSPYGRDPLGTWSHGGWRNQSQLLSYWGSKKDSCDSLDALIENREVNEELPSLVKKVIEDYLLNQLDKEASDDIRSKIDEQLTNINLGEFVDGISSESCSSVLGLASAQNVAEKVAAQELLNSTDHDLLRILLTEAPLKFGYWGPLKTVLKHLPPAVMPRALGKAMARLSAPYPATRSSSELEDLSWFESFTDIPSKDTAQYMAKRLRRQLAQIGKTDPILYTTISSSLLESWDQELCQFSYLPAYVLGGNRPVLNESGRCVSLPMDQSVRRDAYPEAWNENIHLLRQIFINIKVSVETFTFICQVLLAAGEALPDLNDDQLLLALRSSDLRLIGNACSFLPKYPDLWSSLNTDQWLIFLSHASSDSIGQFFNVKSSEILPSVIAGAACFLSASKNYMLLDEKDKKRQMLIAEFYIDAISTQENSLHYYADYHATVTALISLGCSLRFSKEFEVWSKRLGGLDSNQLMDAYLVLVQEASIEPDNLYVLETALLSAELYEYQLNQLVSQAMAAPLTRAVALGWKIIDSSKYIEERLSDLWQWLRDTETPETFTSDSWQKRKVELLRELLSRSSELQEKINDLLFEDGWQIESETLAGLIISSPRCLRAIWQALASDHDEDVVRISTILDENNDLILALGDTLNSADLTVTNDSQNHLLLHYVRARSRVSEDIYFAVAAVGITEPTLQRECLEQLKRSNSLDKCWLPLAELGLPLPLETIRLYLNELESDTSFTNAVLACADSIVPVVRDLGLELITSHANRIEHDRLWPALSQSDDRLVQARVAEESLNRTWADNDGLAAFDRRLLVSRRTNRRAKLLVQNRLKGEQLSTPERRAALIDLARGANKSDREWALQCIAELMLEGVEFDDLSVRIFTTTDNTGGL